MTDQNFIYKYNTPSSGKQPSLVQLVQNGPNAVTKVTQTVTEIGPDGKTKKITKTEHVVTGQGSSQPQNANLGNVTGTVTAIDSNGKTRKKQLVTGKGSNEMQVIVADDNASASTRGPRVIVNQSSGTSPTDGKTTQTRSVREVKKRKYRQEVLNGHNEYRSFHGVEPLVMSSSMNSYAQEWAEQMAQAGKMMRRENCKFGQNTYYSRNKGTSGSFTQMVWSSTKRIGIGIAQPNSNEMYVVCVYDPPGNITGEFISNVHPVGWTSQTLDTLSIQPPLTVTQRNASKRETEFNLEKFQKQVLDAHNDYRRKHNAPPLALNEELNRFAREWAEHLAKTDTFEHRPGNKFGENLYYSYNMGFDGAAGVTSWYDEIKKYNFAKPGFTNGTGHFTQLVWCASKRIGVGVSKPKPGVIYLVANYDPPGNVIGQFEQNVLKMKK